MKKIRFLIFSFTLIIILLLAFVMYRRYTGIKVETSGKSRELLIHTGADYEDVFFLIDSVADIKNAKLFHLIAKKKNYTDHVRPGKYIIEPGMTYLKLIDILRAGRQTPVNVTFNNIRTLNQLTGKVGHKLETDSLKLIDFFNDESNYSVDGFNRATVISVFIPNTYQFYWNTTADEFYHRMLKEYKSFWNSDRLARAAEKKLTPLEVSILASIVDDEVAKKDEKPRIAGVYLNRLKIGMPLQACPTIKFALNDFTITRVLKKYLVVESPYNTYKYKGFPPGPVGCPSIEGLESVLNAEDHNFLYFAARADFSGYHNFSRTLAEHNRYAAQYQKELNKRKIFK